MRLHWPAFVMALGALTAACATDPQRDQEQNPAMDLLYESLFADRPFHLDCTDRTPNQPVPPGGGVFIVGGSQPPYLLTRLDTLNLPRAYVPAITLVSVPEASVDISVEGVAREDWELRLCAQGTGNSEEEARNYLSKVSMNRIGSLVTLDSGGFGPIPLTGGRGHLVVEAPAIAPVTIHNTFGAIAIHDMAGAVSLSSAHARVSILNTTGNVDASAFVIFIGATTCMFAATIGLVQNDIKRIVAYSTCSQLGYMFVAMGVGAYSVGMFHLFTHAFFKALLFLGSGSVILAMHHEQDIRHMGGLWRKIPFTYAVMLIGTLALTGFPFTAGYFSKDAIIEAAAVSANPMASYGFIMTVGAVALTSFYSWRLIFKTFHGEPHDHHHYEAAHESAMTMLVPLAILAFGSIAAGWPFLSVFTGHGAEQFFRDALKLGTAETLFENAEKLPLLMSLLPTVMMIGGFLVAYQFYIRRPDLPVALARDQRLLYEFLLNKWYFDEIYDFLFVRPLLWLGRVLWKGGDGFVIDGFGPDGVSARVLDVTRNVVRLQTGYLYHYAFAMLIGVAAFITWFMFAGPH